MTKHVLVGDVGGTNVRFGLARIGDGKILIDHFAKFSGNAYQCFEDALSQYVTDTGLTTSGIEAVFALAGPMANGTVALTNRDWTVSGAELTSRFNFNSACLVNDFTAMARAVPELDPATLVEIKPGNECPDAPIIIAGPGTGFGVATLLQIPGDRWHVISGEGGHMAYAPQTEVERDLADRLQSAHGYVSNEVVCAGVGLEPVHRALCEIFDRDYQDMHPGEMLTLATNGDEMFLELCHIRARGTMRAAGDLVLANGALGGVVLAGGVSERLIDYLKAPDAIDSFKQRGPNSHYLEDCRVHLLRDPLAPLIGAAALTLRDKP